MSFLNFLSCSGFFFRVLLLSESLLFRGDSSSEALLPLLNGLLARRRERRTGVLALAGAAAAGAETAGTATTALGAGNSFFPASLASSNALFCSSSLFRLRNSASRSSRCSDVFIVFFLVACFFFKNQPRGVEILV